jgi:hypothetical protein
MFRSKKIILKENKRPLPQPPRIKAKSFVILPIAIIWAPFSLAFLPIAIILIPSAYLISYTIDSFKTVNEYIQFKIEQHEKSMKFFQEASNTTKYIHDMDIYDALLIYHSEIKEAYIRLKERKLINELESIYHHKLTLKDDLFKEEKLNAQNKLENAKVNAIKNMKFRYKNHFVLIDQTNPLKREM